MLYWFVDDSEYFSAKDIPNPNVYVYGGIIVDDNNSQKLKNTIEDIKKNILGNNRYPIKWNLKDLKKTYEEKKLHDVYKKLLSHSQDIRLDIFKKTLEIKYKILVSAVESTHLDKKNIAESKRRHIKYSFSNGLKRFGLEARENSDHALVILDWPSGSDYSFLCEEYAYAYNEGMDSDGNPYRCTELKNLKFNDSIYFTTMENSTLLQFTDLIVGCVKDFLESLTKPNKTNEFKIKTFELIRTKFRNYPEYHRYGLTFSKKSPTIKEKFLEYYNGK